MLTSITNRQYGQSQNKELVSQLKDISAAHRSKRYTLYLQHLPLYQNEASRQQEYLPLLNMTHVSGSNSLANNPEEKNKIVKVGINLCRGIQWTRRHTLLRSTLSTILYGRSPMTNLVSYYQYS